MAVTTNFSFLKLVGADSAGYTTINSLIDSIDAILNARIPASATATSVIGRASSTAGATSPIVATVDGTVLQRSGSTLSFAQIDTSSISSVYAGHTIAANIAARPASPTAGQMIYQTDTDEFLKYVVDTDGASRWMQADHDYNRNLVINGTFNHWQRGTSATVSSSDYYGPADRWQTTRLSSDTGRTFSRGSVLSTDTPVLNFNYYMRCQRDSGNTATNSILMSSSFETINVRKMQNKYVTLSFYARAGANYSAASGYLRAFITTGTGTDGHLITSNFTSSATLVDSNNVLTTSWKRFTVTTSAAVGNTITQMGITFQFTPVGTAGAADYYDVTGVQLEPGSAPSDFEFRDFGEELLRCQRYYYRMQSPGASVYKFAIGQATSAGSSQHFVYFPTTMRIEPSLVASGTANHYACTTSTDTITAGTTGNNASYPQGGFNTINTGNIQMACASGLVAGNVTYLAANATASAFIAWNSEL